MPSALIFGGSGKVAKFVTEGLLKQDYKVYSIIRREEHVPELRELGATPIIIQSLENSTVAEPAATTKSSAPDVIIFAAGAGKRASEDPNLSILVDRDAAIRVFDAVAEANGTKRIIVLSTIDARDRSKSTPTWYNEEDQKASDGLWAMLPTYMMAKYEADKDLVQQNGRRALDYTIVRPTWYGEGGQAKKIKAGKTGFSIKVSREDAADVLVACVENSATIGCVFEVTAGDIPTKQAVQRVLEEEINCFEEMYQ